MIKTILPALLISALLLPSCNDKDEGVDYNYSTNVGALNIISNLSDGTTTVSKSNYIFAFNNEGSVNSAGIKIGDADYSLSIPSTKYATNGYTFLLGKVNGTFSGGGSYYDVLGANFYLTTLFYIPYNTPFSYPGEITVAQYKIGDQYQITTFQETTCFSGDLLVTYNYNKIPQNYSEKEVLYQLSLNLADMTASIVINNAKFSQIPTEQPKNMLRIDGLTLEFKNGLVYAKGADIVPKVYDGSIFDDYTDFLFETIDFHSVTRDLTKGEVNFIMKDKNGNTFNGVFSGSYTLVSIN